ncbi:MAG: ParB/RepB/Spo0J family partition protein [Clostridia bacterium]|nr:ParB/RepB/Spo0J family partition protein [Clostridia bacterium]
MKREKRTKSLNTEYEKRLLSLSVIHTGQGADAFDKKELRTRAAHFLLNGLPEFSVNREEDGRYRLLAAERDFCAVKLMGVSELEVRVYAFNEKNAELFSVVERLKTEDLGAMEEAYLMKTLTTEHGLTQDDIAVLIGRSRPAVANTLRLLTLAPEVVGLVESGQLSAGHARTLVKVPKNSQYAFAEEALKRGYSVREMEGAVKAYLTPSQEELMERSAKAAAKNAELKAFVERMRRTFGTKVSLLGNSQKGRILIEYYSPEDLYRIEEFLDRIENFD